MTYQQVLDLIQQEIIANGNNEITADVLRPVLEEMLQQPNDLVGVLADLNTSDTTDIVAAINSILTQNLPNATALRPLDTSGVNFNQDELLWVRDAVNNTIASNGNITCNLGEQIVFYFDAIVGIYTATTSFEIQRRYYRLTTGENVVTGISTGVAPPLMQDGVENRVINLPSDIVIDLGDIGSDDIEYAFNGDSNQPFTIDGDMFVQAVQNSVNKLYQWIGGNGTFGNSATLAESSDFVDLTDTDVPITYGTFKSLTDTPNDYTGQGGKIVKVNVAENALEFDDESEGIPSGGNTGQVLTKQSNTDYDADWEDVPPTTLQEAIAAGDTATSKPLFQGQISVGDGEEAIIEFDTSGNGSIEDDGGALTVNHDSEIGLTANGIAKNATTIVDIREDWNADTNTPALANTDTGQKNIARRVSVAGSRDFGAGSIDFEVDDYVINDGTVYRKFINNNQSGGGVSEEIVVDASVSGTYNIDWSKKAYYITLTGATTLTESNLPSAGNTKEINLFVTGDYPLTLPSDWDTNLTGEYVGRFLNTFSVNYLASTVYQTSISIPYGKNLTRNPEFKNSNQYWEVNNANWSLATDGQADYVGTGIGRLSQELKEQVTVDEKIEISFEITAVEAGKTAFISISGNSNNNPNYTSYTNYNVGKHTVTAINTQNLSQNIVFTASSTGTGGTFTVKNIEVRKKI